MASKKNASRKRISATERATILEEARSKGWTAEQIAKRFGVSKWTVYGWRKRRVGGAATVTRTGGARRASGGTLHEEFRALITDIVREEISRVFAGLSTQARAR
jgi:transposase-like protein